MSMRTVFSDGKSDMDCYMNSDGKLYIGVGDVSDPISWSHVVLDQEDTEKLIEILQNVVNEMKDYEAEKR
jgi:hypothetical protein